MLITPTAAKAGFVLCEKLGLDPSMVMQIKLVFEPANVVQVFVELRSPLTLIDMQEIAGDVSNAAGLQVVLYDEDATISATLTRE